MPAGIDGKAKSLDERVRRWTNRSPKRTNTIWHPMKTAPQAWAMAMLLTFLLGIGNFALHKAVIESRHRVVAVLLLVAGGHAGWSWAYLAYSASNAFAAWLILSHRA